jgi:hypothetical protein
VRRLTVTGKAQLAGSISATEQFAKTGDTTQLITFGSLAGGPTGSSPSQQMASGPQHPSRCADPAPANRVTRAALTRTPRRRRPVFTFCWPKCQNRLTPCGAVG